VCAGADPDRLALLDNFCWCSSNEPERLGQLKRAARACYDYAVAYRAPFISGKDSMFNDFKGFDEDGQAVTISALATLLISSIGIMEDASRAVSLDAKFPGDLVYLLGETSEELGGSEYYAMWSEDRGEIVIGNSVPRVDAGKNLGLYRACFRCVQEDLIASAVSLHRGGLAAALARTAMGGMLGLEVDLSGLSGLISSRTLGRAAGSTGQPPPHGVSRDDHALFSESQGRILVTVRPGDEKAFQEKLAGSPCSRIGTVTDDGRFYIQGLTDRTIVDTTVESLLNAYRSTFRDY
jgi:phosphoribosylformylglycinamidine synthase